MFPNRPFQNRQDAALRLAGRLTQYRGADGLVLAIPRGGVPVGYTVARALELPLEVALAKKIGHPHNSEYAIGAVTPAGVVLDEQARHVPAEYVRAEVARLQARLRANYRLFMGDREPTSLAGKTVIVVDDGIATGHTMAATVQAVRAGQPRRLVVAVPVAPPQAQREFAPLVDEFVCLLLPPDFRAVGQYYDDFGQVSDEEVVALLQANAVEFGPGAAAA